MGVLIPLEQFSYTNASTAASLHTSSLAGHLPSNITSGIPDFTSSLLHQQAQLESLKAELATVESGTSSRALSNGTKLAPDKLQLLSRSQPDLFTGIDGAGLASKEGMFQHSTECWVPLQSYSRMSINSLNRG